MSAAAVPRSPQLLSASVAIWRKHVRKFLGNPEELFGVIVQPVLWVVLFGVGMRGALGAGLAPGEGYVGFMLPGIVALSAMGGAIGGGMVWLDERVRGIVKSYLLALAVASTTDDLMAYHAMIMLLNLPVLFLSNALYPLASLPAWMRVGALANPTTYLVDGMRQTVLGGSGDLSLALCLAVTSGFAALGLLAASRAFARKTKRS